MANNSQPQGFWGKLIERLTAANNKVGLRLVAMFEEIDNKETEEALEKLNNEINLATPHLSEEDLDDFRKRYKICVNRIQRAVSDNFGALIYLRRTSMGMSLQELARKTDVSASYINRIEKGERKAPGYKIIKKIAEALELEMSVLLQSTINEESMVNQSIEELLYTSNVEVGKVVLNQEQKKVLVELINAIVRCEWSDASRHIDSVDIINLITKFKGI